MAKHSVVFVAHKPTVDFWEGLPSETREELCDAAVFGLNWNSQALRVADGRELDRRTLGRLIDAALMEG